MSLPDPSLFDAREAAKSFLLLFFKKEVLPYFLKGRPLHGA
jgi:hypothetical protein